MLDSFARDDRVKSRLRKREPLDVLLDPGDPRALEMLPRDSKCCFREISGADVSSLEREPACKPASPTTDFKDALLSKIGLCVEEGRGQLMPRGAEPVVDVVPGVPLVVACSGIGHWRLSRLDRFHCRDVERPRRATLLYIARGRSGTRPAPTRLGVPNVRAAPRGPERSFDSQYARAARRGPERGDTVTERPRLAILFDAVEEGWPSMDYVAEMLVKHLQEEHAGIFETRAIKPRFFGGFERLRKGRATFNADRAVTRFLTYPASLAVQRRRFELFHVADHSYAQLAHVLPAERTGIYCHDLDAFAAAAHARAGAGWWRRGLARLLMAGLERAAVVFHSTAQIRKQLEAFGALDPRKLVHAPYGVHPDFFASSASEPPPGLLPSRPYLLHVGSGLPRKRLDVLFRVYAAVRERHPDLVLVQQGAVLNPISERSPRNWGSSPRWYSRRRWRGPASPPSTGTLRWCSLPATAKALACRWLRHWPRMLPWLPVTSPPCARSAGMPSRSVHRVTWRHGS